MLPLGGLRLAAVKLTLTAVCLTAFLAGERIGHVWTQRPGLTPSIASGLLWNPLAPPRASAHPAVHKTPKAAAPSQAPVHSRESSGRHTHKGHGKAKSKHSGKNPKQDHHIGGNHGKQLTKDGDKHRH
jgi:hypothetical protein